MEMSKNAGPGDCIVNSIRRHLEVGLLVAVVMVFGAGCWAATAHIAGAVIASGNLVVGSNAKKVQHPTGGVVSEIHVRDGDQVVAGDLLLRLDSTVSKSSLAILVKNIGELTARKARLESERDNLQAMILPQSLAERASDPEVAHTLSAEQKLFDARYSARQGQRSQLEQRIEQLKDEISGQLAQVAAKSKEIELIERELAGTRDLWLRNLVPISKLTSIEREATRLAGERAQLIAATAQVRGKIVEIEMQILQIDRDHSSEVNKELREVDAKIAETIERRVAAEDQLKRVDIRAPQSGVIHQSVVHTLDGVIAAGETLMLIIPTPDNLVAEVKIRPQDIDQVQLAQTAVLRFPAFNQRTTPEFAGTVGHISADVTTEQRTGQNSFTVRIKFAADEVERLNSAKLVPGMPVEAQIQSGERTALSYLVKPLTDQLRRAFRER